MSKLTLGGLTLCEDEGSNLRWVRLGAGTPQGWNPVPSGRVGYDFNPVSAFESYITEVEFK